MSHSMARSAVLFPLSIAAQGDRVRILHARVSPELEGCLQRLGFREGSVWDVVRRRADGAMVVACGSRCLILTAALAECIAGVPVWERS